MPAQFAGSRSLDDRRRRRLAQEAQDSGERKPVATSRAAAGTSKAVGEKPPLPDESLIPRAPWKIAAIACLGFLLWAGNLWLALGSWPRAHGLHQIGALVDGTLPKLLTTAALLLAAQLSYLILWYRSRARKDFQGRYRVWGWSGLFWAVTCLCVTTGLHLPTAKLLYECYPLDCWRPELTYWLAPFAIGVLALYRLLGREMAHCRSSSICWHLTMAAALVVGGLELGGDLFLPAAQRVELVAAANTLWHGLITLTFLLHARFVVHETNEAGPARPNIPQRLWRSLRRVAGMLLGIRWPSRAKRKPRRAPSSTTKKKPSPVRKPLNDGEQEVDSASKKRVLGKNVRIDPPRAEAPPAPHAAPVAAPAPAPVRQAAAPVRPVAAPVVQTRPPVASQQPAPTRSSSSDEDDESENDRWVSKKERKKLKQGSR